MRIGAACFLLAWLLLATGFHYDHHVNWGPALMLGGLCVLIIMVVLHGALEAMCADYDNKLEED